VNRVLEAYEAYEFHVVYHTLVQYAAADLSSFYLDVLKDRLYCEAAEGRRRRAAQTVLHRIARDLCLLLSPVLPFTTDEAWAMVPGATEPSVHIACFPQAEREDRAVLDRWAVLLDTRSHVTKALEEARTARLVASSLEARVTLRGSRDALEPLRAHEATAGVFPSNLASLFIVSGVRLEEGEGPLAVTVERAPGKKCERCWTFSEAVGTLPTPSVCERCTEVLSRP